MQLARLGIALMQDRPMPTMSPSASRWPPVMLLDDVMSELDGRRRRALVELLRSSGGQAVITATDPEQVPGAEEPDVHRLEVGEGAQLSEPVAGGVP